MDDRRAQRRRQGRGQPQPDRPRVLRVLDAAVHARVALSGGRPRARRAGRRGADRRCGAGWGIRGIPARRRDTLPPGVRSASVSASAHAELTAPASGGNLAGASAREQTRARYPDDEGFVERGGVRIFWERYGDGDPTVLLLPTWSVVHSRHWKLQIPY